MKRLVLFFVSAFFINVAFAEKVPPNFLKQKDALVKVIQTTWNDIPIPSAVPGLIEQETCYSLTHSKCWSNTAKLETSREYGFGLGQLTVTKRFNAFEEVKGLDRRLKGWKWGDRFNSENQMIGVVVMLKRNYRVFKSAESELDHFAFALASYNGGVGGIQADRRICRNTKGCNPNLWFGHVEKTSLKQKTVVKGYGQSFFQINRKYPINILNIRRQKYKPYVDPYFNEAQ